MGGSIRLSIGGQTLDMKTNTGIYKICHVRQLQGRGIVPPALLLDSHKSKVREASVVALQYIDNSYAIHRQIMYGCAHIHFILNSHDLVIAKLPDKLIKEKYNVFHQG